METALRAAMEAKQRTLRPEIQLLNRLLAAGDSAAERAAVFDKPPAPDALTMNDRYFFSLLDRMAGDVARQKVHEGTAKLVAQLAAIKQEALQRAPTP